MALLRVVIGGLLAYHGLVHAALWLPQAITGAPSASRIVRFDPGYSWLLSGISADGAYWFATLLALAAVVLYVGASIGMVVQQQWWRAATVAGSMISLVLLVLYFTPWLLLGIVIDAALLWILRWQVQGYAGAVSA